MPYNSPAFSYQGEYFKKTVLLEMTLGWISHTIKSWVTYRTVPKDCFRHFHLSVEYEKMYRQCGKLYSRTIYSINRTVLYSDVISFLSWE